MLRYRRYRRRARQSTRALTAKFTALAIVASLAIGGLIAAQMATGDDPALGPKAAKAKKATASSSSAGSPSTPNSSSPGSAYYPPSTGYSTQQSSPAPVTSSTS
jgi:hypothetical protein